MTAVALAVHPRRQRGGMTAAERRAIELHAVTLATQHFAAKGWTVDDIGATESYDLHCSREEAVLRVEVKGGTGALAVITLTANEVAAAHAHHPDTALYVVRHIALDRTAREPTAHAGTEHVGRPWRLQPERLRPIAYAYELDERVSDAGEALQRQRP